GRALLIDAPRTWQAGYSAPLLNQTHHDEKIRQAQEYLHGYFSAQFTMDELAQRMGMSTRNFTRRFKQATGDTPVTYLHKLRIDCAKHLLETDFKSVQEVCYEVGYEDIPFFRDVFRRYTGMAPREYKQRFASHYGKDGVAGMRIGH
ncbi:MAG: helix-turn-helix domain-containing protein, partial [Gammaproteobacteria bacterium]